MSGYVITERGVLGVTSPIYCFSNPHPYLVLEMSQVTFCAKCGNNVHVECIEKWKTYRRQAGGGCSCPYCRQTWREPGEGSSETKYMNLAEHSMEHRSHNLSVENLYGDRAVWIKANQGLVGKGQAVRIWRSLGHH